MAKLVHYFRPYNSHCCCGAVMAYVCGGCSPFPLLRLRRGRSLLTLAACMLYDFRIDEEDYLLRYVGQVVSRAFQLAEYAAQTHQHRDGIQVFPCMFHEYGVRLGVQFVEGVVHGDYRYGGQRQ